MRTFVLTLAAVAALAGTAPAQTAPGSGPAAPPSPAPSAAAVVHVKNFAYAPETVTIAPGQTVRFVQDDETPHTVTATDTTFDSGNLDQHATWSHTFAAAGTYAYYCAYHTYMKGTVVVKP